VTLLPHRPLGSAHITFTGTYVPWLGYRPSVFVHYAHHYHLDTFPCRILSSLSNSFLYFLFITFFVPSVCLPISILFTSCPSWLSLGSHRTLIPNPIAKLPKKKKRINHPLTLQRTATLFASALTAWLPHCLPPSEPPTLPTPRSATSLPASTAWRTRPSLPSASSSPTRRQTP
jgi:hypothetical protein